MNELQIYAVQYILNTNAIYSNWIDRNGIFFSFLKFSFIFGEHSISVCNLHMWLHKQWSWPAIHLINKIPGVIKWYNAISWPSSHDVVHHSVYKLCLSFLLRECKLDVCLCEKYLVFFASFTTLNRYLRLNAEIVIFFLPFDEFQWMNLFLISMIPSNMPRTTIWMVLRTQE